MSAPFIVFLHDARYDRVHQAVTLTATAASMGRRTGLCLFYDALLSYVRGQWDDPSSMGSGSGESGVRGAVARGLELSGAPSLYQRIADARAQGLSVYACSASIRHLGLDPKEVAGKVDAVVGIATLLELAGAGGQILYI